MCFWAPVRAGDGDAEPLVATDDTARPAVVTITSLDTGFRTRGCRAWHRIR